MLKKKSPSRQKNADHDAEEQKQLSILEADKTRLIDYLLQQQVLSKETLNLNPETAQSIYEQAYQLYSAGQYAKAKSLFTVLLVFNPTEFQFLYSYATCCFMLKEYEIAAECFVHCGDLDSANPLPYFYASDCYIQLQDLLSTCTALRMAVKRAGHQPEYAEIRQRAQLTLDALTNPQEDKHTTAHSHAKKAS